MYVLNNFKTIIYKYYSMYILHLQVTYIFHLIFI